MTIPRFIELLRGHPDHSISFVLPDGSFVAPHFHITEVGHLSKSFIDCGGKRHTSDSCLLQIWLADDTDHRLKASKLLGIFERSGDLLPSGDLPVEIEHEAPVLTQLPITRCEVTGGSLNFHTELKHADCLAKDICLPDFTLPALPGQQSSCSPGTGCC
jgi:hypothetical protein